MVSKLEHADLTEQVIGAAIEVHRELGPGLLESVYELCLFDELQRRKLRAERQVEVPVKYRGRTIECGYRIDLVVERSVLVELKAIEKLMPIHEAQLLTYLRLASLPVGLLVNFNVKMLKNGVIRRVLTQSPLRDLLDLRGEETASEGA